jgi:hypothetical protein
LKCRSNPPFPLVFETGNWHDLDIIGCFVAFHFKIDRIAAPPRAMMPFLRYLADHPESVVNLLVFSAAVITFWISSHKDRELQRRRTYTELEFEASRIFTVCVEHPDVPRYLQGDLPPEQANRQIEEKAFWFVSQVLNIFEIATSFRREGLVSKELFATWVSWFHELGTSARFGDYWDGRHLRSNYKSDLRKIMDAAQRLRNTRQPSFNADDELQEFHDEVARLFGDDTISTHFAESRSTSKA